jgi:DNA-binding transcriptional regulator YiaG
MTGPDILAFRRRFGLSRQGLADVLRMNGKNTYTTVRRWETGELQIPVLAELVMDLALTVPAVRKRLGLRAVRSHQAAQAVCGTAESTERA